MKKTTLLFFLAAVCAALSLYASELPVPRVRYAGPFPVNPPFLSDSVNVKGEKFDEKNFWVLP